MNNKEKRRLMTTTELCDMLQLNRVSIGRLRKQGLPSFYVGANVRFEHDAVMKWIKDNQANFKLLRNKEKA
jgi:hypothetical protein